MNIIQNTEETYGEVKFTLSEIEIDTIIKRISSDIYSSNGKHDTMLKEDGKLLLCKPTVVVGKYLINLK